jgi:hypothetical protein
MKSLRKGVADRYRRQVDKAVMVNDVDAVCADASVSVTVTVAV